MTEYDKWIRDLERDGEEVICMQGTDKDHFCPIKPYVELEIKSEAKRIRNCCDYFKGYQAAVAAQGRMIVYTMPESSWCNGYLKGRFDYHAARRKYQKLEIEQ